MTECLERVKHRHNVGVTQASHEEEQCRDIVRCEHFRELLSMLAAKEEILLKLILLQESEGEILMDDLEADIVKMVDYHDNVDLPLKSP